MIDIQKYLAQIILIAVIAAGVGFFAGMKYQQLRRGPMSDKFGDGPIMIQDGTGRRMGPGFQRGPNNSGE